MAQAVVSRTCGLSLPEVRRHLCGVGCHHGTAAVPGRGAASAPQQSHLLCLPGLDLAWRPESWQLACGSKRGGAFHTVSLRCSVQEGCRDLTDAVRSSASSLVQRSSRAFRLPGLRTLAQFLAWRARATLQQAAGAAFGRLCKKAVMHPACRPSKCPAMPLGEMPAGSMRRSG